MKYAFLCIFLMGCKTVDVIMEPCIKYGACPWQRFNMARKWKRHKAVLFQQPPQQSDVNMIEKSIKKHEEKPAFVTYAYQDSGRQSWPKVKYDKHITDHQKMGFVIGASVVTKYGIPGTIVSYLECRGDAIEFYGGNEPCCVYIKRNDGYNANNNMIYGFYELTLKEQS